MYHFSMPMLMVYAHKQEDQLMTFAARSHLFRVAKLCEAEARRYMADGSHGRPFAEWDSLNAVYRRLVYANALAMVQ